MKNMYGFNNGDCIDNSNMMNDVLGRKIGWVNFGELENDWRAFFNEPQKYKNTVVVDMVNKWADEKLEYLKSRSECHNYGAQYVMLSNMY